MNAKLIIYIVSFFVGFSAVASDQLQLVFSQGMQHSNNGEYTKAAKEFRKMLSIDASLERPRLELALVLFKSEQYEGAEYHLKKVLTTVESEKVKVNIRNFLSQIRQKLPQLNLTVGFVSDTNPNQETSAEKVTIGGMEFDLGTTSKGESKSGYEVNINAKVPISIKDKTFVKANLEYTDYSGSNNEKTFLSTSYGKHFNLSKRSSITPEVGVHRFIHQGNTLYSGKNISINYFNAFNDSTNAELDYKLLDYKYPDYTYMDGKKRIVTAKLSKFITQNNRVDVQLSKLNSDSVDKTISYKQSGLTISNTIEFNGGWSVGLVATVNKKDYLKGDPFFGVTREDKEEIVEFTILNGLFNVQGMSPKLRLGRVVNNSNIALYEFDRNYSKLEFTKEF